METLRWGTESAEILHVRGYGSKPLKEHRRRLPYATAAWLVHAYTASGAIFAFAGLVAVFRDDARTAFLWMTAATFVDATDGIFARLADVKRHAPSFDGARLDDIVDYLTFVFLPAFFVYHFRMAPDGWGLPVAGAMLLSSAYGFAALDAKTSDHFFTGFPSYWNIVVLYLYLLPLPRMANALLLVGLAALVFVRIGYVYPSRTPVLRGLTLSLGAAWALLTAVIVWMMPQPPLSLVIASLAFPVYYVVLSLILQWQRR